MDDEWVEAEVVPTNEKKRKGSENTEREEPVKHVKVDEITEVQKDSKGDEWLSSLMIGQSRYEKEKKAADLERERKDRLSEALTKASGLVASLDTLDSSGKDTSTATPTQPSYMVGDGGASWRKKKIQRSQQQASESGQSVQTVLKERFGETDIKAALNTNSRDRDRDRDRPSTFRGYETRDYLKKENENDKFKRPTNDRDSYRDKYNKYHDDRDRDRERNRDRDHDRERYNGDRDRNRGRENDRDGDRYTERSYDDRDRRDRNNEYDRNRKDRYDSHREKYDDDRDRDRERDSHRSRNNDRKNRDEEKEENIQVIRTEQPNISDLLPHLSSKKENKELITTTTSTNKTNNNTTSTSSGNNNNNNNNNNGSSSNMTLNKLSGELMKAKMMGNIEKIKSLEKQIKELKEEGEEEPKTNKITGLDEFGRKIFMNDRNIENRINSQREKETDDVSLKDLVRLEKRSTDQKNYNMDMDLLKVLGKSKAWVEDDREDYGPEFDKSAKKLSEKKLRENQEKDAKKYRDQLMGADKKMNSVLDKCWYCPSSGQFQSHMMVARGNHCYLTIPTRGELVPGHCMIVPLAHITSIYDTDEEAWDEITNFKKCLIQMFNAQGKYMLFMETAMKFKKQFHAYIECIPLSQSAYQSGPGYFKKSLMECESEWDPHKLIDTIKRGGLKTSIPKSFPYFWIEFGYKQTGYLHPIQSEYDFPKDFGRSIIMGMLELDLDQVNSRRKSKSEEDFIVNSFKQKWKPFDWTEMLQS